MTTNLDDSSHTPELSKKATEMDQGEFVKALFGLSTLDRAFLICFTPGALRQVGIGGILLPWIGLPSLLTWAQGSSPQAPGLIGLQQAYDACFTIPPGVKIRRGLKRIVPYLWRLMVENPRSAAIALASLIALVVSACLAWPLLFPGIGCRAFYDQVGQAASSSIAKLIAEIEAKDGEKIDWTCTAYEVRSFDGAVILFKIRPLDVLGSPPPPQEFTVHPKAQIGSALFASLPTKVRLQGTIGEFDTKSGVRIYASSVTKAD